MFEKEIQLLNFLYKPEYKYEVGYKKDGHFSRNKMLDGDKIPSFIFDFKADDKYILSYPSTENTLRKNLMFDKIWLDFDTDNPEELPLVKEEVFKFARQLNKDFLALPYIQFSGSKGYHMYIYFMEPIVTEKIYIQKIQRFLEEKYNLKYVCQSCITGPIRLQRLPYTKNTKSGLYCLPLNIDIRTSIRMNKLHDVAVKMVDTEIKKREFEWERRRTSYKNTDTSVFNVSPQIIWEEIYGHLIVKQSSKYFYSDCPWHTSNSGDSVMVGEKVAFCHKCGKKSSYHILLDYYGGDIAKTMEHLKKYQE